MNSSNTLSLDLPKTYSLILCVCLVIGFALVLSSCHQVEKTSPLTFKNHSSIVLTGNNLCARMLDFGHLETHLQTQFADSNLVIRNVCDGGNTAGFRPHPGRENPWAFPGAEAFHEKYRESSHSEGHFASPDEWLNDLEADIILGFFGYNESFEGPDGIDNFKEELRAFVYHSLSQKYNGESAPQLVLISPTAIEDKSGKIDVPDGKFINANLQLYTDAMRHVAVEKSIRFVDVFTPTSKWMNQNSDLTIDGLQLNADGYAKLASFLSEELTGLEPKTSASFEDIRAAVIEKNWMWDNYYNIPNGVHVYGRRYEPFGIDNYPKELQKLDQLCHNRDQSIWAKVKGQDFDLIKKDKETIALAEIKTNLAEEAQASAKYLYGQEALASFQLAEGYKLQCFASEEMFPELANPVQMSFDNRGRLWVAVMPSYPHFQPGDTKPNDKLLIFEDTDKDGVADLVKTFADQLHLPLGFELTTNGVYVSQGSDLIFLYDEDQDDVVEKREVVLSGFDHHDSHHAISAFCADPSGALYMAEGVFLHTNVETLYGPVRATNGGFYRYDPRKRKLERTAQIPIPNPWGIAFDRWGQNFFLDTSGPPFRWMSPSSSMPRYGVSNYLGDNLIEDELVRPTSGLEFVSSSHFPASMQGDVLLNNTIGFLGAKQHKMIDDGASYRTEFVQNLIQSNDPNYRPVDLEFAPDGSLYITDWHNMLIGHMQHNARDPLRDHQHGRIYRITYTANELVKEAKIHEASINDLFDLLADPSYRTRYRVRRELRGRSVEKVMRGIEDWLGRLDPNDADILHHKLEALWVSWGMNEPHLPLLEELLEADNYKVRAAAVKVLRYQLDKVPNHLDLLRVRAQDAEQRVRLEVATLASWMEHEPGSELLDLIAATEMDQTLTAVYANARAHINGQNYTLDDEELSDIGLTGMELDMYLNGKEIYSREGYCGTCHQPDGKGLEASNYPGLHDTEWVLGDKERLIKLTLNGMMGELEIHGKKYPGNVPMTPFGKLLNDEEVASVLTYVRNAFGNKGECVYEGQVKEVRANTIDKIGFYTPQELLAAHPLKNQQ